MEIIILVVIVVAVAGFFIVKASNKSIEILDVNQDGKVDQKDIPAALDINKDGKVNVDDVKAAVKKTKTAVKTRSQRKNKSNGSSSKH
jgi:biopolymer transport protein ExbD